MNDDTAKPNLDAATPAGHGPSLTAQQRDVHDEVARLDRQLAEMYLGAVYALDQRGNPDRFAQAAHSLRELMEKLPALVLRLPVKGASLGDKARQLANVWARVLIRPSSFDVETTPIAEPLLKFLDECSGFFQWLNNDRDNMRARVVQLYAKFEPTGRELPETIERIRSKRWISVRSYFNRMSKHSPNLDRSEFLRYLDELERMLIDLTRPRVCDELDAIDQVISDGESRDS